MKKANKANIKSIAMDVSISSNKEFISQGYYFNMKTSIANQLYDEPHGVLGQTAKYLFTGEEPKPRNGTDLQGGGVIEVNGTRLQRLLTILQGHMDRLRSV